MKTLIWFLFAISLNAQSFSIPISFHPIKAWKESTKSQKFMFASSIILEGANTTDLITTYKGVVVGANCETNPVFQSAPCSLHNIRKSRFYLAKSIIALAPIAEYIPTWIKPRVDSYSLFFGIVNIGASIPFAIADVNNIEVLRK